MQYQAMNLRGYGPALQMRVDDANRWEISGTYDSMKDAMMEASLLNGTFVPTLEQVEGLKVGDMAPMPFGIARVIEITYRGVDIHGNAYVGYRVRFGKDGAMTGSMKVGETAVAL